MRQPSLIAHLSRVRRNRNRPKGISLIKKCRQCKRNFRKKIGSSWKLWIQRSYCSRKCQGLSFGEAQKGKNNPNYGNFESKSAVWKGDKVGYDGIHAWLRTKFGKASICENSKCLGKGRTYEWALIKGREYERKRKNFWQLCHSCHKKYDRK